MIGQRREKLADQIDVGSVDLHPVEPGLLSPQGRPRKSLDEPVDLFLAEFIRPFPPVDTEDASPMVDLEENSRSLFLDRLGQFGKAHLELGVLDPQAAHIPILFQNIGRFNGDQARPAPGPLRVIIDHPLGHRPGFARQKGDHGRHDDPISYLHRPNLKGPE